MLNIKEIRSDTPRYETAFARRGIASPITALLQADEALRSIITAQQTAQARRNDASKEIGQLKASGKDASALMAEVAGLKDRLADLDVRQRQAEEALNDLLLSIPNIPAGDVPDGANEKDNVEIRRHGTPADSIDAPDHVTIGERLGLMDFETAAKLSGARFVVLRGDLARLERALAQFMLDTHTRDHGYTEISPPLMVRDECMLGTAQLPKFHDDQFQTTRGDWLIPTSEVPLTNLVREQIMDEAMLPLRFTAFTPCFRAEAGAAGRDTRGMIRQHQFYKVEMVSITSPDHSADEHARMTKCAETILERLELPYRTMLLCAGDMGFAATKTHDLEVWIPSQGMYREISSCSNCGDFQARRMNARCRARGESATRFVHTLNGSGLAVGRTLVAVLENNYVRDGNYVRIPDVLRPYMGGRERIEAVASPSSFQTTHAA